MIDINRILQFLPLEQFSVLFLGRRVYFWFPDSSKTFIQDKQYNWSQNKLTRDQVVECMCNLRRTIFTFGITRKSPARSISQQLTSIRLSLRVVRHLVILFIAGTYFKKSWRLCRISVHSSCRSELNWARIANVRTPFRSYTTRLEVSISLRLFVTLECSSVPRLLMFLRFANCKTF